MSVWLLITRPALRFFASSLEDKLVFNLVLARLAELTLFAVIELWANTERDLPVHCIPALILADKSIELIEERFDPWIGAVLLILHHRCVKRAS